MPFILYLSFNQHKKQQTMKKLHLPFNIIVILLLSINFLHAQSTTNPDSVCVGATNKSYKVNGTPGSTYLWVVNGGTKTSGANTDSITIDWSTTPGIDTLKVVEYNVIGCPGDTILLAVVRVPLPTVVLAGTDSICNFSSTVLSKLQLDFTGLAPWVVTYLEDGITRTVTTSSNPYNFNSQVFTTPGLKSYSIDTITGRVGCSGSGSGAAEVTVFPKPSTSSIAHY